MTSKSVRFEEAVFIEVLRRGLSMPIPEIGSNEDALRALVRACAKAKDTICDEYRRQNDSRA